MIPADQICWSEWQQAIDQLIDDGIARRRARSLEECIARVAVELERAGECSDGIEMGAPPLPALEGAHGMNGEARDSRQFFLRETCGFAKPFQVRAKQASTTSLQDS